MEIYINYTLKIDLCVQFNKIFCNIATYVVGQVYDKL